MRRATGSTAAVVAGRREAQAISAVLGREVREARRRRRLTQAAVAARVGCSRARLAELERGEGANAPLGLWVRIGVALDRPLAVAFSRDTSNDGLPSEPRDAGHLAGQELVLRLGRLHGRRANVELPMSSGRSPYVADVVQRDDLRRVLMLTEIVNRAGDLGAISRSSDAKTNGLEGMAILAGGDDGPYRVTVGWLLIDSAANRKVVATYQEFLRARCPGSSAQLAQAMMAGAEPPQQPAIAWIDPRAGRVSPLRWRSIPRP